MFNSSFEIVEDSNIKIGPGSYYGYTSTFTEASVRDERGAWELVERYDRTTNPVVMFQLGETEHAEDTR
jgi:hypothetical protein